MQKPDLWNASVARQSLKRTSTHNPTLAAAAMLGKHRVRQAVRVLKRSGKKRAHRGNPAPAVIAAISFVKQLIKLPKFLKTPSEKRAAAVAPALVSAAAAGNLTAVKAIQERSTFGIAAERAVWQNALNQVPVELQQLAKTLAGQIPGVDHKGPETAAQTALERAFMAPSAAAAGGGSASGSGVDPAVLRAGTSVATAIGKQLISRATRAPARRRTTRVRQVNRYDPDTGDKYRVPSDSVEAATWPSRKPSARSLAGAAGGAAAAAPVAAKAAGLAGASGAAVAGVVIGGLAVGLLIGTGLRKLFGTARAVRAEEAAVQGALVLRNTRAQLEDQLGRPLNQAETRAMFSEYAAQLEDLGFVQKPNGQWHRPRTFTERLLG